MSKISYRIGQIVPSSNTTMETEVPALLRRRETLAPERFTFHYVDVVVASACVQMQSLPAIDAIEARLGLPVTSTAVCTTRPMLDKLGLDAEIPGGGALLTERFATQRMVLVPDVGE
jgi:maleate cis-trans isomerase